MADHIPVAGETAGTPVIHDGPAVIRPVATAEPREPLELIETRLLDELGARVTTAVYPGHTSLDAKAELHEAWLAVQRARTNRGLAVRS